DLVTVFPPPGNAGPSGAEPGASINRRSFSAALKARKLGRSLTLALVLVLGSLIGLALWRGVRREHARSDSATSRIEPSTHGSPAMAAVSLLPPENPEVNARRQKQ